MSPPSPAERRLQEISHLFLSTSRARSLPPSPLQPASATSEPRRSLPPRVIAVGSATDPLVTTFTASALAVGLRARGRRVLLFDGVGQPWFLRQLLAIEGGPERPDEVPDPLELRRTGLTCGGGLFQQGQLGDRPPSEAARWAAAEAEADFVVILLPCHSLAAYLERFLAPWQEHLVVTEPSQEGVGGAFARLREVHRRLPEGRLGVMVAGAARDAAAGCFAQLARAARRLLRVRLRSYGYHSFAARRIRELAAGRVTGDADKAAWRREVDGAAALLVADGRPRSCPAPTGYFFDVRAPWRGSVP